MATQSLYAGGDPRFGISPTYLGEQTSSLPIGGGGGNRAITSGGGGAGSGMGGLMEQYPELFQAIPAPEIPIMPTPQVLDIDRIRQLTQQFASPAIREARAAIREALSSRRGSPIQRQYETRGALEGAGQAMETAIAGARQPAWSLAEREAERTEAAERYRTEAQWKKSIMEYQEKKHQQQIRLAQRSREEERNIAREEREREKVAQPTRYLGTQFLKTPETYNPVTQRWAKEKALTEEMARRSDEEANARFEARKLAATREAAKAKPLGSSGGSGGLQAPSPPKTPQPIIPGTPPKTTMTPPGGRTFDVGIKRGGDGGHYPVPSLLPSAATTGYKSNFEQHYAGIPTAPTPQSVISFSNWIKDRLSF